MAEQTSIVASQTLIRAGERIKVGHSANLSGRLRAFQTGNAEECHVVNVIWLRNAAEVEHALKDSLAEYRHRKEGFNVSTRQAVEKLWGLRRMFVYDEQPQLARRSMMGRSRP